MILTVALSMPGIETIFRNEHVEFGVRYFKVVFYD